MKMNITQELIADISFAAWTKKVNEALKWQWTVVPGTLVMTATHFAVVVQGETEDEEENG